MSETIHETTKHAISLAVQARVAVLLTGRPGTGKTQFCYELGRAHGLHTECRIPVLADPTDALGMPRDGGPEGITFRPFAWAIRLSKCSKGLLIIDELNWASDTVQASFLKVVDEGRVGELASFADHVAIVAAINPSSSVSGVNQIISSMANRFVWLNWTPDTESFIQGMASGWKDHKWPVLPSDWQTHIPRARTLVAAFAMRRPNLIDAEPEDEVKKAGPWPSRRTWDMVAVLTAACDAINATKQQRILLTAGAVGEGAGLEFINYLELADLPDFADLLMHPEKFVLPKRDDLIFAVLSGVVQQATKGISNLKWTQALKILGIVADAGKVDLAVAAAKDLAQYYKPGFSEPKELDSFLPVLDLIRKVEKK